MQHLDLQACSQRAMAVATQWRLPFGAMAWRGSSGDFAGQNSGNSIDFHDHRLYQLGDDPRHINWNAYARTGQHSLKQFRQEVQPVLQLLVDGSASMWLDEAKARRSAELVYVCCHAAQLVHAQIRVQFWNGEVFVESPMEEIWQQRWLERVRERVALAAEPEVLARWQPAGRGLRVWISDLLFAGSPQRWLRHFCPPGQLGVIFAPYSVEEANPSWDGAMLATDAETGQQRVCQWDAGVQQRYRQRYQQHFGEWQNQCRSHGLRLCRVASIGGLNEALIDPARLSGALVCCC